MDVAVGIITPEELKQKVISEIQQYFAECSSENDFGTIDVDIRFIKKLLIENSEDIMPVIEKRLANCNIIGQEDYSISQLVNLAFNLN